MRNKDLAITGATLILISYTLILSFAGQAMSAVQTSRTVSNAGEVTTVGVGIYWDSSCNNALSSIDWGTLDPGSNKNIICYIQNDGNSPSTLSLQTSNWNPSEAETYLTLTWDYDGHSLSVDEVVQVTLTLTISETTEGITNFSFDITIVGTS